MELLVGNNVQNFFLILKFTNEGGCEIEFSKMYYINKNYGKVQLKVENIRSVFNNVAGILQLTCFYFYQRFGIYS